MSWWAAAAQAAMEIGKEWMNSSAQHKANRTNIQLAREQREWSEQMSNTAVQRLANDIEKAGGNRALAFTNGQSASTPTVSTAEVRAPRYQAPQINSAMLTKAQTDNLKADTVEKLATARSKTVQANIDERTEIGSTELAAIRNVERGEQERLKTKIMDNIRVSSAAEAKRLGETVDSIIKQAAQAAEKGDLEVKQLRNIVDVGGLDEEDKNNILRYLIDVFVRGK